MIDLDKLPQSTEQLLDVIIRAERTRRYVWTAKRVVSRSGVKTQLQELDPEQRKDLLQHLTGFLKDLAAQGFLVRRPFRQSVRNGDEIGFDFVRSPPR
jgi:hypothetical protein